MLDASTLHDALRAEGLVPPEEDVHLLACSNRWRHAIERAFAVADAEADEGESALQEALDAEETEHGVTRADLEEAERQLESLQDECSRFEGERDRALERAVELEAELAKLKAAE